MVVLQVYIVSVAVTKAERHAPITADRYAPNAFARTLQLVKPESWHIQFGNVLGSVKVVKNNLGSLR